MDGENAWNILIRLNCNFSNLFAVAARFSLFVRVIGAVPDTVADYGSSVALSGT
jgi:hypothetical protein